MRVWKVTADVILFAENADDAGNKLTELLGNEMILASVHAPQPVDAEAVGVLKQLAAVLRQAAVNMTEEEMDRMFLNPSFSRMLISPELAVALQRLREKGKTGEA